jgi:hypothetical protein
MKKSILILIILCLSFSSFAQKKIEVKINNNVEFVSMLGWLIFIGEKYEKGEEYINWENQKYQIETYNSFKKFSNSENIKSIKDTYENEGFDAFIYLFCQLDDFPNCKLKENIDSKYLLRLNDSISYEEAKKHTEKVIFDLNKLYVECDFAKFLDKNKFYYQKILKEVSKNLPNKRFIKELEKFYNNKTYSAYILNPSLMIPSGWGFGPNIENKVYNFFGSFNGKSHNSFGFDNKSEIIELSTHEYGHSFVNHIIDSTNKDYIIQTEHLFEPIKKDMKNQGYSNWKTCLYEHFVRAGEIIIAKNLGDYNLSKKLEKDYIEERKFIYLPIILIELEKYNVQKNKNYKKTVELIMTKLI